MYDILYSIIGADQKNFASELLKAQTKGKGLMYNEFQDLLHNTPNTQTTWDTYMQWVKEKRGVGLLGKMQRGNT